MSGVWRVGPHRLLCGDATTGDLARLLAGVTPGVIYTDPPWDPNWATRWRRLVEPEARVEYAAMQGALAAAWAASGAPLAFVEMGERWAPPFRAALDLAGWRPAGAWPTRYGSRARPALLTAWTREPGRVVTAARPAPLGGAALVHWALAATPDSTGVIILDPCIGLGTTARVAHALGLTVYGLDLHPGRLARTRAWLERATGQPARQETGA